MKQPDYLLDTNILSALIKDPKGNAAQQVRGVGADRIFTSIIVASEMQFGIRKKASDQLTERVESLLASIQILDFKPPADLLHYGELRHLLQKSRIVIDPNDLLIAAHVLSENLIMVTENVNEFNRVPRLNVENWL